jgi:gluconolactonase
VINSRVRVFVSVILSVTSVLYRQPAAAEAQSTSAPAVTIMRRDPRFDALIAPNTTVEKIADGFSWVEGPVWHRKEHFLLFSDVVANTIFKWQESNSTSLFLKPSGYTGSTPFPGREPGSNGLAFDLSGRLVMCEHGDRRVSRLEADGTKTTLVDRYQGKRLNSPNDLLFTATGDLYFTDPPFGLPNAFTDPARELDFCGVYHLSVNGTLALMTKDLKAPNGIAFSPDGKKVYVSNADQENAVWMMYDVKEDGTFANGRLFFDATAWTKTKKGVPDGIKIDIHGNLFTAGPGGIYVLAPDGAYLGGFDMEVPTANCAWGNDGSTLYIAANTALYRVKTATTGLGF